MLLLCPMPLHLSHFFKRRISVCCGLPPAALPTALASFAPALDARQPPPVTPVPPIAMPSEGGGLASETRLSSALRNPPAGAGPRSSLGVPPPAAENKRLKSLFPGFKFIIC